MAATYVEFQPLLGPIIALCAWTLVMEVWMYWLRLPAYSKYNVNMSDPDPKKLERELKKVPAHIYWAGENYNHLMEQPTQFYVILLVLVVLGVSDRLTVVLAWLYVGLRVAHSIVQATINSIPIRFRFFAASGVVLAALTANAAASHWKRGTSVPFEITL